MKALDTLTGALREARAALLNHNLSEPERFAVVKVLEGAITVALTNPDPLREALELTEEALSIHVLAREQGADMDDGDALALQKARKALGR